VVSRQKLPDGSVFILKAINYIARDSVGRTHTDGRRLVSVAYEEEPPITAINIYDPGTGVMVHLDPSTFIARQTKMRAPPVPGPRSVPDPNPNMPGSPVKQVNDLGTRMLKGMILRGTRQTRGPDDFDEYWYSADLSLYVSRKHQDPIWEQTINIAEVERAEPDPSNFTVPAAYKIVEVAEALPPEPLPGTSGLYTVGGEVLAPKLVHAPDPKFSPQARKEKYQGVAVVSVVVDAQGNPTQVHITRHLGMGLDEEAIAAVEKYKFAPATLRGKPVPVQVNVEVNFRIY
jgi:TonB family protein